MILEGIVLFTLGKIAAISAIAQLTVFVHVDSLLDHVLQDK